MNTKTLSKNDFLNEYFSLADFYLENESNHKGFYLVFFLVSMGEFYPDKDFLGIFDASIFRGASREDWWEFWSFWAKSERPDLGLLFLKDSGVLEFFPELFGTIGVAQNPKTHPEGDVFTHMVLAVKEASEIGAREKLSEYDLFLLMFGVLCHDLGKQVTFGHHEMTGISLAKRFLLSIGAPSYLLDLVGIIVKYHTADYSIGDFDVEEITQEYVDWLVREVSPVEMSMMYLVHEADVSGRGETAFDYRVTKRFRKIMSLIKNQGVKKFSYDDILHWTAAGNLPNVAWVFGQHQQDLLSNMNHAVEYGYVDYDDAGEWLRYAFSLNYREALLFLDSLDYRSKKRVAEYMTEAKLDLDELLIRGKSGIEKILNTPSD